MGATVRDASQVDTNVVDPGIALGLPVPMTYGTIDLSLRFEQHPGGTLTYKGIHQDEIGRYERAYREGRQFYLLGCWVMVESYGYTRERMNYGSAPNEIVLDTYEVSVSLTGGNVKRLEGLVETKRLIDPSTGKTSIGKIASAARVPCNSNLEYYETSPTTSLSTALGANVRRRGYVDYCSRGVKVRSINSGSSWRFSASEVKTDGENTRSELPYYKKAVLQDTWSNLPEENEVNLDAPEFKQKPKIVKNTLLEEDENPDLPPPGTTVLRTLDNNFDKGGPKRTRKKVYLENGTKVREEFWVWAFMYTAEDISVNDASGEPTGLIFSDKPEDYWPVVEYTDTIVNYQEAPLTTVTVECWDDDGKPTPQIIHPNYKKFAIGSGRSFSVKTTQELMVEEVTQGWRYARFQEETEGLETLYPDDPFYETYQFQKLAKKTQRSWSIKPSRETFTSGEEAQPFRVEFMQVGEMPPELQRLSGIDPEEEPERLVAVVYPDPAFNEQFWTEGFTEYSNSFKAMQHPEDSDDNPTPPLVTGQESLKSEKNTPYNSESDSKALRKLTNRRERKLFKKHRKRTVSYSSQDAGFQRSALQIKSQEFDGPPSSPSSRNNAWKEEETDQAAAAKQPPPEYQYLITSDRAGDLVTGSVSAQNVESLEEAKKAIRNQLIIDTANAISSSRTIMWWLPRMRPWDRVRVSPERFQDGTWRVLDVSFSVEVDPPNTYTDGKPFCTTEGTQLRLGLFKSRSIKAEEEELEGEQEPTDERGFRSKTTTKSKTLGGIVDFLKDKETRRQFDV